MRVCLLPLFFFVFCNLFILLDGKRWHRDCRYGEIKAQKAFRKFWDEKSLCKVRRTKHTTHNHPPTLSPTLTHSRTPISNVMESCLKHQDMHDVGSSQPQNQKGIKNNNNLGRHFSYLTCASACGMTKNGINPNPLNNVYEFVTMTT